MAERVAESTATTSTRRVSVRGEEFEVAGRAGPVELVAGPPIPAEARAELLVIKAGRVFLCARPDGISVPALPVARACTHTTRDSFPSCDSHSARHRRFSSRTRL